MNKTAVELMLILVVGSVIMIDDKLNHNFPKVLDTYSRDTVTHLSHTQIINVISSILTQVYN